MPQWREMLGAEFAWFGPSLFLGSQLSSLLVVSRFTRPRRLPALVALALFEAIMLTLLVIYLASPEMVASSHFHSPSLAIGATVLSSFVLAHLLQRLLLRVRRARTSRAGQPRGQGGGGGAG